MHSSLLVSRTIALVKKDNVSYSVAAKVVLERMRGDADSFSIRELAMTARQTAWN